MDFDEIEDVDYAVPSEKLYAVVELVVDKPNDEGESDVEKFSAIVASNWLLNVKRIEDGDNHVKYVAGTCKWPKNETKLAVYLERRSKPSDDWISYSNTLILKFCRSLGQAKDQAEKAISNSALSESDTGLTRKRMPVKPVRFGCEQENFAGDEDSDLEPPPMKSLRMTKALVHASSKQDKLHHPQKQCRISQSNGSIGNTNEDKTTTSIGGSGPSNSQVLLPESGAAPTVEGGEGESDDDFLVNLRRSAESKQIASSDDSDSGIARTKSNSKPSDVSTNVGKGLLSGKSNDMSNKPGNVITKASNSKKKIIFSGCDDISPCNVDSPSKADNSTSEDAAPKNSKKWKSPSTPTKKFSFGRPNSFSPRKLTSTLAPVSHFTFKKEMDHMRKSLDSLRITQNKIYNCLSRN